MSGTVIGKKRISFAIHILVFALAQIDEPDLERVFYDYGSGKNRK